MKKNKPSSLTKEELIPKYQTFYNELKAIIHNEYDEKKLAEISNEEFQQNQQNYITSKNTYTNNQSGVIASQEEYDKDPTQYTKTTQYSLIINNEPKDIAPMYLPFLNTSKQYFLQPKDVTDNKKLDNKKCQSFLQGPIVTFVNNIYKQNTEKPVIAEEEILSEQQIATNFVKNLKTLGINLVLFDFDGTVSKINIWHKKDFAEYEDSKKKKLPDFDKYTKAIENSKTADNFDAKEFYTDYNFFNIITKACKKKNIPSAIISNQYAKIIYDHFIDDKTTFALIPITKEYNVQPYIGKWQKKDFNYNAQNEIKTKIVDLANHKKILYLSDNPILVEHDNIITLGPGILPALDDTKPYDKQANNIGLTKENWEQINLELENRIANKKKIEQEEQEFAEKFVDYICKNHAYNKQILYEVILTAPLTIIKAYDPYISDKTIYIRQISAIKKIS